MTVMPRMISYPFRLGPDRRVVTVEPNSSEGAAQRIAQILMTMKGERALHPDFGMTDPVWSELKLSELRLQMAIYGPFDVAATAIDNWSDATTQRVTVRFNDGRP